MYDFYLSNTDRLNLRFWLYCGHTCFLYKSAVMGLQVTNLFHHNPSFILKPKKK